jgi:hypothetical protein
VEAVADPIRAELTEAPARAAQGEVTLVVIARRQQGRSGDPVAHGYADIVKFHQRRM